MIEFGFETNSKSAEAESETETDYVEIDGAEAVIEVEVDKVDNVVSVYYIVSQCRIEITFYTTQYFVHYKKIYIALILSTGSSIKDRHGLVVLLQVRVLNLHLLVLLLDKDGYLRPDSNLINNRSNQAQISHFQSITSFKSDKTVLRTNG